MQADKSIISENVYSLSSIGKSLKFSIALFNDEVSMGNPLIS